MSLPKEIKANQWLKNWSGKWKTAFASMYWLYTTDLKPYIGLNFEINLLVCEKEFSSNYIAKKDLDSYSNYVADLIIKDNKFAEKLAKDTLTSADKLFEIVNLLKNKENLNLTNLIKLKKLFYEHIPPHLSLKKVIDYLPKELQERLYPLLSQVRLKIEDLFNQVDFVLIDYTNMISDKSGYERNLTNFLTINEIITFFEEDKLPEKEELLIRTKGLAIFCKGNKFSILSGKDYQKFQKVLFDIDETEVKGSVGFRGIAKGIARIVFNPNDVREFNDGDILITGMTRPEFLPLMKRAGAFVTDAGGLLSHAAIIARELGKPCILGTENATKIIKNNDEVEVDANKGIVRILKRFK